MLICRIIMALFFIFAFMIDATMPRRCRLFFAIIAMPLPCLIFFI